jgi:hypothetical protein
MSREILTQLPHNASHETDPCQTINPISTTRIFDLAGGLLAACPEIDVDQALRLALWMLERLA